jgi:uncharacterized membrane protein
MKRLLVAAGLLSAGFMPLATAAVGQGGCRAPHYRLVELPLRPASISDSGDVAGRTEGHRAALWTRTGGLRVLPLPDGYEDAEAVSINRRGYVLGNARQRATGASVPFRYAGGQLTVLPGEHARVYGMNDSGVVVGSAVAPASGRTEPAIWSAGALRLVDSCCGGAFFAMNARGEAIGNAYDDQGHYHAVAWSDVSGVQPIGPTGKFSTAVAINASGHAVVQAFSETLLYADGALTPLALSPRYPSKPLALSDCDVIVGAYGPFSDADRAFIWDRQAGFQDLNDVLGSGSGWKLEYATGINSHGVIVGSGEFHGEDDAGFMLIPAP